MNNAKGQGGQSSKQMINMVTYIRKLDRNESYLRDLVETVIWNVKVYKATTLKQDTYKVDLLKVF